MREDSACAVMVAVKIMYSYKRPALAAVVMSFLTDDNYCMPISFLFTLIMLEQ